MRRGLMVLLLLTVCGAGLGAQSAASARRGGWPLEIGLGLSGYRTGFNDFGRARENDPRMEGLSGWLDVDLSGVRFVPRGLEIEAKASRIWLGNAADYPSQFREKTVLAGPLYRLRWSRVAQPYARFLVGYSGIVFPVTGHYWHEDDTIYAPGGGVEVHAWGPVWARADYEYQIWPGIFGSTLNPQGVTVGASYDFHRR